MKLKKCIFCIILILAVIFLFNNFSKVIIVYALNFYQNFSNQKKVILNNYEVFVPEDLVIADSSNNSILLLPLPSFDNDKEQCFINIRLFKNYDKDKLKQFKHYSKRIGIYHCFIGSDSTRCVKELDKETYLWLFLQNCNLHVVSKLNNLYIE